MGAHCFSPSARALVQHRAHASPPPAAPTCRANKKLREIFGNIIRARRASGQREEDCLQQFIDAK